MPRISSSSMPTYMIGFSEPNHIQLNNGIIDEKSGTYLSEDLSFCKRWTDMGGEI